MKLNKQGEFEHVTCTWSPLLFYSRPSHRQEGRAILWNPRGWRNKNLITHVIGLRTKISLNSACHKRPPPVYWVWTWTGVDIVKYRLLLKIRCDPFYAIRFRAKLLAPTNRSIWSFFEHCDFSMHSSNSASETHVTSLFFVTLFPCIAFRWNCTFIVKEWISLNSNKCLAFHRNEGKLLLDIFFFFLDAPSYLLIYPPLKFLTKWLIIATNSRLHPLHSALLLLKHATMDTFHEIVVLREPGRENRCQRDRF